MPANTTFQEMYDFFLAGITDDMFMELTKADTEAMLHELLVSALPYFEFPQQDIFTLDETNSSFCVTLTSEEMMIIRQYMIVEWIGQQLATVDLIRQKYSGSDFKFTSQAAHLSKLISLRDHYKEQGHHLQRLYNRRKKIDGVYHSTFNRLAQKE